MAHFSFFSSSFLPPTDLPGTSSHVLLTMDVHFPKFSADRTQVALADKRLGVLSLKLLMLALLEFLAVGLIETVVENFL